MTMGIVMVQKVLMIDRGLKMTRMVMCKGTWPEDNYADFEVFEVENGETDGEAIERAKRAYSPTNEFFIMDKESED